jgi:hypothetical protein
VGGNERGAAAIHAARELTYQPNLTSDVCWRKLSRDLRARLTDTVGGTVVERWAGRWPNGTITAVALGPAGLTQADPASDSDGRPGHQLRTIRFAPDSLWVLDTGAPDPLPSATPSPAPADPAADSPLDGVPLLEGSLIPEFRWVLGHLPAMTQIVLQERFAPRPDLTYNHYVEVVAIQEQKTWRFFCYIADDTTLTFGCGTNVTTPPDGGEQVWDVTCYRATVTEPMPPFDGAASFVGKRRRFSGQRR